MDFENNLEVNIDGNCDSEVFKLYFKQFDERIIQLITNSKQLHNKTIIILINCPITPQIFQAFTLTKIQPKKLIILTQTNPEQNLKAHPDLKLFKSEIFSKKDIIAYNLYASSLQHGFSKAPKDIEPDEILDFLNSKKFFGNNNNNSTLAYCNRLNDNLLLLNK